MSAFRPRERNRWPTNPTSGGGGGSGDGGCYAIANETSSVSGIYFSHDEATKKILETRSQSLSGETGVKKNVDFRRFDKVRDAEAFLKDRGFAPAIQSGGWISARNKSPILYAPTPCKERVETESDNHDENANVCTTTNGIEKNTNTNRRAEVTPLARSTVFTTATTTDKGSVSGGIEGNENDLRRLWSNHNHGTETEPKPNEHTRERSLAVPSTRSVNVPRWEEEPLSEPSFRSKSGPKQKLDNASPKAFGFFQPGYKASPLREERRRARNDRTKRDLEREHERERVRKRQRPGSGAENSVTASVGGGENTASASASAAKLFASPPPDFDAVQQEAIDAAMTGKNVFVTGVAGTGKSLVTKRIVQDAKRLGKEVAVAAPTGVAAVNLGPELAAQTVHSLAGVGVPQAASGFEKMLSPYTTKKWKKIQVLVLDEIGMLGADFLDWMDVYVRKARRKPLEAFGGIQLIFVGDFAQLGPIPGRGNSLRNKAYEPSNPGADCLLGISECAAYAFQTVLWREANFHHVHLRKVYRQKNRDFQLALMDIREAKAESQRVKNLVDTCSTPLDDREGLEIPDGIKPTILYCTNRNVDRENFVNLAGLTDKGKIFEANDSTSISADVNLSGMAAVNAMLTRNAFFKDCSASKKIHLKVGAQVMLLQNLDTQKGLVNGSRGVVEAFKLCPVAKDILHGEERLIGPDDVDKFPGCRFEDLKFNQKTDFEGKIWRICRYDRYPLVRFINNTSKIIVPQTFERTLYRQGKCLRLQIPLRLAWALTIHKSQGATLDYVVCDLQGCFTSGQAYVALSRARSMLGLQIKNFSSKHVTADPLVEAFYDALDRHDTTAFLEEKAGLWWFPILKSPTWLKMFQRASSKHAKHNSEQFRSWVAEYKPLDGYRGWGA